MTALGERLGLTDAMSTDEKAEIIAADLARRRAAEAASKAKKVSNKPEPGLTMTFKLAMDNHKNVYGECAEEGLPPGVIINKALRHYYANRVASEEWDE